MEQPLDILAADAHLAAGEADRGELIEANPSPDGVS